MTTVQATSKNVEKGINADWELYDFICDHSNLSMYQIHKELGWSTGKIQKAIDRLEKRGYVESKIEYSSARPKRIVRCVEWQKVYQKLEKEKFEE